MCCQVGLTEEVVRSEVVWVRLYRDAMERLQRMAAGGPKEDGFLVVFLTPFEDFRWFFHHFLMVFEAFCMYFDGAARGAPRGAGGAPERGQGEPGGSRGAHVLRHGYSTAMLYAISIH